MLWIWDGKPEWLTNYIYDHITWLPKLLCVFAGHLPERDQCGIPDHDYCLYCGKSTPGQWMKPV